MKVKKYIVNSLADAMPMIKQELGQDAIILNSKKIKVGGFFGFFSKEKLEVIAASDQEKVTKKQGDVELQSPPSSGSKRSILEKNDVNISGKELGGSTSDLTEEIRNMKALIQKMVTEKNEFLPLSVQGLSRMLKQQEIDTEIIAPLISNITIRMKEENEIESDQKLFEWLKLELLNILSSAVKSKLIISKNETFPKVISFVGPTGVGKTTTIAKLAADMMLNHKKQIGFITTDTYRIAAVEQLKTYANILNIPIEVVYASEDIGQALEKLKECDMILMDTAGRNYFELEYIEEMKPLLPTTEMETYLVLSLTSKTADIEKLMNNFQALPIQKLILTKMDETNAYGSIINILYKYSIPLIYITTGQNVPDDIIQPDSEFIVEQMINKIKELKVNGEDAHEGPS